MKEARMSDFYPFDEAIYDISGHAPSDDIFQNAADLGFRQVSLPADEHWKDALSLADRYGLDLIAVIRACDPVPESASAAIFSADEKDVPTLTARIEELGIPAAVLLVLGAGAAVLIIILTKKKKRKAALAEAPVPEAPAVTFDGPSVADAFAAPIPPAVPAAPAPVAPVAPTPAAPVAPAAPAAPAAPYTPAAPADPNA